MRTAIDTNVISGLWSAEPLSPSISRALDETAGAGGLVICAPVYAELLAHPKASVAFVDNFLNETGIAIDFDLGEPVWREASVRFAKYAVRRRASRGGSAKRLLADFIVGAHALIRADRLLTLDASRYAKDFPELKQITCG
jgi:predicted nucleic acid-binding protein